MNRPKINWPHQTKWDKINDKLWGDYEIVESYRQMLNDTIVNHSNRDKKDELRYQLKDNINKFHHDFINGCQEIVEDIFSKYIGEYNTKETRTKIENEIEYSLIKYVTNWVNYVDKALILHMLLESLLDEDLYKLKIPTKTFIEMENDNDLILHMETVWVTMLNELGVDNDHIFDAIMEMADINKFYNKRFNEGNNN